MEKISEAERRNALTSPDDYIRVAVVGNVDSGKSTLVGVLTKGACDDGRGSARLKVFNYAHEAQNGRTSSIAQEIMGFDADARQVFAERFVQSKNKYWAEVAAASSKVVALVDLCGHERYLKTTMLGMVGLVPDYVLIVVGANLGLSRMTKEHLGIALALNLPFLVVVTKADMVSDEVMKQTLAELTKLLSANVVGKKPLIIDYDDDDDSNSGRADGQAVDGLIAETRELRVHTQAQAQTQARLSDAQEALLDKAVQMINSERICPIFKVSSVSARGIPQLARFLYKLKSRNGSSKEMKHASAPVEFDVHERFVVQGIGLVVSGLLKAGTVRANSQLLLGPNKSNEYRQVLVRSVHFNRVPVDEAYAGQFCCLALKPLKKKEELERADLRKGIVLLDASLMPKPCWAFEAEVSVLHHSSTIKAGYEAVMHVGVVRQSVHIVKMDAELLRTGDKGNVTFRFMFNSEHLKPNSTFLLREGRTKILGFITRVYNKLDEIPA